MIPSNIEFLGQMIGPGKPCFIVAEIGVNHNGNVDLACEMIREAKHLGADCVKFQTFRAERVATRSAPKAAYQVSTTTSGESQFEMLKRLELSVEAHEKIIEECRAHAIGFLSTPYSTEDADFLEKNGAGAYKIASAQIVEPQFLAHIASKGKPVLLSTGMADLGEVEAAVRTVFSTGNQQLVLMQCTTEYPSRHEDANLRAMSSMAETFGVLAGYSDHTTSSVSAVVAAALGAVVLEKHFTLDKTLPGPDHAASAEPGEFGALVRMVREAQKCLGSAWKRPCEDERRNRVAMRRSLVASRDISVGEVLAENMLAVKRPAVGLSPSWLERVVGQKVAHDIPAESSITLGLVDWSKEAHG